MVSVQKARVLSAGDRRHFRMKTIPLYSALTIALLAGFLPAATLAAIPDAVPYQGRVAVDGTNFTGTGQFKFAIYEQTPGDTASAALLWTNAAGATSGTVAEPASSVSLPVTNGLYGAGLGDTALANMAALPVSLAPATSKRAFVRVWFDDGTHGFQAITPDLELRAAPFAREAANTASLGGVAFANFVRTDTANVFTAVDGVTITGTGPSADTPATGATVPVSGAGTRMEFLPGYSAFRAGTVTGSQWDAVNIGLNSTALGYNTVANGYRSTAIGSETTASGSSSVAVGNHSIAGARSSTALGFYTTASGFGSTALGCATTASGDVSTALGYTTTASGEGATALGYTTTASGRYATALGASTTASGDWATTSGHNTTASGVCSTAMGHSNEARIYCETVIGAYAPIIAPIGGTTSSWDPADPLFMIGNGTSDSARSIAFIVLKNGNAAVLGALAQGSDRNRKTDIVPADTAAVLAKVGALPLATWKYKDETVTHLGPMAQDFFAAFQLGGSDTSITSIDADGVALASIQELAKRVATLVEQNAAKDARIAQLETTNIEKNEQINRLAARLAALEAKIQ